MKTRLLLLFALLSISSANSQIIFSEDFQGTGGTFGAGWTLINQDGLIPNASVAYVNNAWIIREDFVTPNNADSCAFSTSWYTPAGIANDWMITPQMSLTANNQLSWEAMTPDVNYADDYEVRISTTTPTIAGFNANPVLYTTTGEPQVWTAHSVSLAAYAGQNVYLAWRNKANDEFLLMIDDIVVEVLTPFDVAMSDPTPEEYTIAPVAHVTTLGTDGTISNIGSSPVTNANMTVNVYDGLMTNVYTGTSNTIASIAGGASANVIATGYTPTLADIYTVQLIANITEADGNQLNDTVYSTYVVSDSIYARDNGVVAGTIGIGPGTTGQLGQAFDIVATDDITTVSMFIGNNNLSMSGQPLSATVFATDALGTPTTALVSTTVVTVDTTTNSMWTLPIVGGSYTLAPGNYVVVVNEPDSNVTLGLSDNNFTLGTTWVLFGANPWTNNEGYGINQTYVLRANFGPVACVPTASTVTDAACLTYTWAQNGMTYTSSGMYTDVVMNAMGCDSTITLDLTINVPTTATQTVSSCSDYTWAVDANVYTTTGMYTAVIPNAAGCDSTITLDLTIGALDVTTSTATFTISANVTAAAYQWIDCGNGNAIIPGENGQSYTATANGDYAVILTDGSCVDTSACVTITGVGLNENVLSAGIEIFPNPSNGEFTVSISGIATDKMTVVISEVNGKIIMTKELSNTSDSIELPVDLAGIENGVYFVTISADDQRSVQRIVVAK